MHQSILSANIPQATTGVLHLLLAQVPGFVPSESPRSQDLYHLNRPGVGPIIHYQSTKLSVMPHEGTFQLQTDLLSIETN